MKRKTYIKKIKYPFAFFCIIIGLILAYCSFYYAGRISKNLYFEEKDIKDIYHYKYELAAQTFFDSSLDDIRELFKGWDMTAIINEVHLYIDDIDATKVCRVYLQSNSQDFPYQVVSGYIPDTDTEYAEKLVVVGKELKKYTRTEAGQDYISICKEDYKVAGYISSENSVIYDNSVILFANAIGNNCREEIENQADGNEALLGLALLLYSDEVDVNSWINNNRDLISKHFTTFSIYPEYDVSFGLGSAIGDEGYMKYAYLLYVFSLVILMMIIRFWILERKAEFMVRRIAGYERKQLIRLIAKELAVMIFVTSLLLFLLQGLLEFINNEDISIQVQIFNIIFMILFFVITFTILMIAPIYHIVTDDIVIERGDWY